VDVIVDVADVLLGHTLTAQGDAGDAAAHLSAQEAFLLETDMLAGVNEAIAGGAHTRCGPSASTSRSGSSTG
jgi:hypothetical protein